MSSTFLSSSILNLYTYKRKRGSIVPSGNFAILLVNFSYYTSVINHHVNNTNPCKQSVIICFFVCNNVNCQIVAFVNLYMYTVQD